MKIVIVGGGIGGIAAYHALRKHLADASPPVTILVLESHENIASTASAIGGGLGLAPNGLRAISLISPDAAAYIEEQGFPGEIFSFLNSKGKLLGRFRIGRKARYGLGELMLPRATVHDALLQELRPGAVAWNHKVRSVKEDQDGVELMLENGTVERADLVIGADGVRSVVREAIFGHKYDATYEGLTGVGGFIPINSLSESLRESIRKDPVTMTFGPDGFFGYSPASRDIESQSAQLMWWSTYETVEPPPRDTPRTAILDQLMARHANWVSPADTPTYPVFREIIAQGCAETSQLLILPGYVTPRLPHWSSLSGSGRILLLGDSSHCLPPHAGQGVACAVEDAVAIALLLKHYRVSHRFGTEESLRRTAAAYETVRMKRVGRILDLAKYGGQTKKKQSWWQEKVRDFFMWLLCKLPESLNDAQFAYDIEAEIAKCIAKSGCEPMAK
ncbi:FAD-binding protein [Mycena sanguinolenta]|uniref:FAD-binding protein n=1 Tax=Mycena sanguinolenta TaxID=230812 RepID=A0A8H6ZAC3_9AGAR|nr:FAD-binding protein [Mycena sanguinolenta]